jgi:hypothetical protein
LSIQKDNSNPGPVTAGKETGDDALEQLAWWRGTRWSIRRHIRYDIPKKHE